ncbi:MAG: hypothetical protein P8M72_09920 [Gammaproteobacteria bacterium]|nr:hypothetical protein [Gammaproteobacteria bacterium]
MSQDSQYKALVATFSKVITASEDEAEAYLAEVERLSAGLDKSTIKAAMAEASVMSVADSNLTA